MAVLLSAMLDDSGSTGCRKKEESFDDDEELGEGGGYMRPEFTVGEFSGDNTEEECDVGSEEKGDVGMEDGSGLELGSEAGSLGD